jgi:hypothetical protein
LSLLGGRSGRRLLGADRFALFADTAAAAHAARVSVDRDQ